MEQSIAAVERGLAATCRIVELVQAEQWSAPTCCAGWDVRAVVNHMVGGFHLMAGTLTTGRLEGDFDRDWLGPDAVAAYDAAAQAVSDAWDRPSALPETVTLTFGTVPTRLAAVINLTEVVVHGGDIAVATGAEHLIDEDLCADLLATMHRVGIDGFRVPGIFGAAVPADRRWPAHRRLMAYLGRTVLPAPSLAGTGH